MKKRDMSLRRTLSRQHKVHGVAIVKLPMGKYLEALDILANPTDAILEAAFPDMTVEQIMDEMRHMDEKTFRKVFFRVLMSAPKEICKMCCRLFDIPEERLMESGPQALTLNELTDVLIAFWRKNDMSDFFVRVRALLKGMLNRTTTGSNPFSQSESGSV